MSTNDAALRQALTHLAEARLALSAAYDALDSASPANDHTRIESVQVLDAFRRTVKIEDRLKRVTA